MTKKNKSIGFLALQHLSVPLFPFHIVLCVADEHGVPFPHRRIFDALKDQSKKRIRDSWNGDETFDRSQSALTLGRRIRHITEKLYGQHHDATLLPRVYHGP